MIDMNDTPGQISEQVAAYRELLEHSFRMERERDDEISRLTFLSDQVFDFTTYDDEVSDLLAGKALEMCACISENDTFGYASDAGNYRWFIIMVNMPFFARRLDWGTSIRGAFWTYKEQTLESCGIWHGDKQAHSMKFTREEWLCFITALIAFSMGG